VRNLGELTRGMGGLVSGRLKTIGEYAILVGVFLWCLLAVGFLDFKRYQPPRGTTTLDQLVASLPETLKFAVVEQAIRRLDRQAPRRDRFWATGLRVR
jgi:uncharacterized protein YigA (DUF484 family)